jgi:hypothetical protein
MFSEMILERISGSEEGVCELYKPNFLGKSTNSLELPICICLEEHV